jgi:hypothetical protein
MYNTVKIVFVMWDPIRLKMFIKICTKIIGVRTGDCVQKMQILTEKVLKLLT